MFSYNATRFLLHILLSDWMLWNN